MNDEVTDRIIEAAIEVHRQLGPELLEGIYEDALCCEFDLREIEYTRLVLVPVVYKGKTIREQRIDLLVDEQVNDCQPAH